MSVAAKEQARRWVIAGKIMLAKTLGEADDILAAAIREAVEADQKQTYDYAKRLCVHMAAHFPANPDWRPLPHLMGVLTQIDNMLTAMVHEDAVEAEREACAAMLEAKAHVGPRDEMTEFGDGCDYAYRHSARLIRARGKS